MAREDDFLAVDATNSPQTQKIRKSDLLNGYITDAPNNESTKNWTWARRNGNWYRIYPDDYIFEAPMDGAIYVRINGEWAKVEGVSGDMLRSIYDTHNRLTDIFDYADKVAGIPDNATESLLGSAIIRVGRSITKDFGIVTSLLDFVIRGETIELFSDPLRIKSFLNPSSLSGLEDLKLYVTGRDLLRNKEIVLGSYYDAEDKTTIRTNQSTKVNAGERYFIKRGQQGLQYRFFSVNRINEPDGVYVSSFLSVDESITIPSGVEYLGVECRYQETIEGNIVYKEFQEPYEVYLADTIVSFDAQFNEYKITCNSPLYSLEGVTADYIDFTSKKEIHNIAKETLTSESLWRVSTVVSNFKKATCIFELDKTGGDWNDSSLVYGNSETLKSKSLDNFLISDEESIAFYKNHIYIRISYENLQRTADQSQEELLVGLENFLYEKSFNVIYSISQAVSYDIDLPELKTYDSITNFLCIYSLSYKEEDYFGQAFIEGKFQNVVDNLVRKAGDEMHGRLVIFGENNLVVHSILGSNGNGAVGGPLYINNNNQEKVFVNGENPLLDLRDFTTKIDWEPKAKTIPEKEVNDKRLVNAEYIHRDYAPLDSPPLVGIPTSTKAEQLGTNQIATGEFVAENYYNKEEADRSYIHSVDGVARGELVLEEVLPQVIENKKRIPNIEFIENYYYDIEETDEKFAPLDSPNLTGVPTTPIPDEVVGAQITNVDYVKNNYFSLFGGSIYGDVTIEGVSGDSRGNLTVHGVINNAQYDSSGETVTNGELVVVTNENGDIITSTVTTTELQALEGINGNIQSQIDNIPKYNYLTGLSTDVQSNDWPAQGALDAIIIPVITKVYPSPALWDAVAVAATLRPSDKKRDLLYYYSDGSLGNSRGWYYLYDLSTTINRANGDIAGIVADSDNGDVTFNDGHPTVHHAATATKLKNIRTINGTNFDGTTNVTTLKWGTPRNLTIGNGVKSVDGSGNVIWTLGEIGALPLAGGTMTGNLILNGSPTSDLQAATKQYVDNAIAQGGGSSDLPLIEITKTLALTTSWQDTGIKGADLESGSYMIQISGMNSSATSLWNEVFTGVMSWYDNETNSLDTDEILLHKAGHANNGRTIYLRTARKIRGQGNLSLQIAASTNFSSSSYTFKFRKMI